jgi:hypothetical protein
MRSSTVRGRTVVAVAASLGALAVPVPTSAATGAPFSTFLAGRTFLARGDAACTAAGHKVEKLPKKQTTGQIDADLAIVSDLLTQLHKLTPPPAAAAQFKQFLAQTERQVRDVRSAVVAARKNQPRTVARYLKATAVAGQESNATAADIGLRACSKNYSPEGS